VSPNVHKTFNCVHIHSNVFQELMNVSFMYVHNVKDVNERYSTFTKENLHRYNLSNVLKVPSRYKKKDVTFPYSLE
jgi:hypothetical protein